MSRPVETTATATESAAACVPVACKIVCWFDSSFFFMVVYMNVEKSDLLSLELTTQLPTATLST